MSSRINTFLELAVRQGGSDLHLVSGEVPRIRLNGVLQPVRFRELTLDDMRRLLLEIMEEEEREKLKSERSVDFAYEADELGRFRVNAYLHVNGLAAVLRVIPTEIKSVEELGLPNSVAATIAQPSGLTLVTGPTGSGKSTTLAAMVDHINRTRKGHIITVEDPIEFVHDYKECVVTQREIGRHSPSFAEALRNALREDPDVVLVGEMRDLETISLALTATETGIQVLGTLHTAGAMRTLDRIINVFPEKRQDQVRAVLAEGFRMVVSQQLVPTSEGTGRVAALEVLINNHAVGSMIRSGKAHQLMSVIQSGSKSGMQSLDAELQRLVDEGRIAGEDAYHRALDKTRFEQFASVDEEAA